jgi:UDP-N-acetylmuramoyl-L-alanyl-D-glutamate--2,6-diaminopimelate ligase
MNDPPTPWTLSRLAAALSRFDARVHGEDVSATGLSQDSRRIVPGDIFAMRDGGKARAIDHLGDARARGAVAVMCEPMVESAVNLPRLVVRSVREALAFAAEAVHGRPSRKLGLVGITGTNGKTTTSNLLCQCLDKLGLPSAQLGTLGFGLGGQLEPFGLTTPEADLISAFLRRAVDLGARHAVMEVSSHALESERVAALHFQVAAFSNLTQDHLDFHGTLERYGAAKARLFTECSPEQSVLNIDDAFGAELASRLDAPLLVGRSPRAAIRLLAEEPRGSLRALEVQTPSGPLTLRTRLLGAHNADNWLLCLGVLHALGCDLSLVATFAPSVQAAPGRFERCDCDVDDVFVVVDYAHTEDALTRALAAARPLTQGRVICVFGCGGDRDKGKRAPMGAAAGLGADYSFITNDNPRSEEPEAIAQAVEDGLVRAVGALRHELCLDRSQAIERAVLRARPGDVVLIAGKGHEDYQILGDERIHFDDREQARLALQRRRETNR